MWCYFWPQSSSLLCLKLSFLFTHRLASGARIIIQSRVPPDYNEISCDSWKEFLLCKKYLFSALPSQLSMEWDCFFFFEFCCKFQFYSICYIYQFSNIILIYISWKLPNSHYLRSYYSYVTPLIFFCFMASRKQITFAITCWRFPFFRKKNIWNLCMSLCSTFLLYSSI